MVFKHYTRMHKVVLFFQLFCQLFSIVSFTLASCCCIWFTTLGFSKLFGIQISVVNDFFLGPTCFILNFSAYPKRKNNAKQHKITLNYNYYRLWYIKYFVTNAECKICCKTNFGLQLLKWHNQKNFSENKFWSIKLMQPILVNKCTLTLFCKFSERFQLIH